MTLLHEDAAEQARLTSVVSHDVADVSLEGAFDRIIRVVAHLFEVPIAAISFVEKDRTRIRFKFGLTACETPRDGTFCDFVTRTSGIVVVPDALRDERFVHSRLVVDDPHVRFYAGAPLKTQDGHTIGALCAMDSVPRTMTPGCLAPLCDLADVVMSILDLGRLATVDSLTGAMQRRGFLASAVKMLALARRHHLPMSIVSFDLDHFKTINDRYGHATGDAVLKGCVATCQATLRTSDIVGRLGGEEFVVLLPCTDHAAALVVAENLRRAVAGVGIPTDAGTLHITASFGVGSFGDAAPDIEALLRLTDAALYVAKAEGRNRCASASTGRIPAPVRRPG